MVAVVFCLIFHAVSERKVNADKTGFISDRVSDDDMGVAITQRWMPLAGVSYFCSGLQTMNMKFGTCTVQACRMEQPEGKGGGDLIFFFLRIK